MKSISCLVFLIVASWQVGCFRSSSRTPSPVRNDSWVTSGYVDLQPGTNISVVVPILRSGGYVVPSVKEESVGGNGNLTVGADFLGYETDFYSVRKAEDGLRAIFIHGEERNGGKRHKVIRPRISLFEPATAKYFRLVFLTRASNADHNMAIVSSDELAGVEMITRAVTNAAECRRGNSGNCTWVPAGIAVRPE